MRSILVVNSKGGCGKSTLVVNLAGYFAVKGKKVTIADFDPQSSSLDWLQVRPADRVPIQGIAAWKGNAKPPKETEYLIMDAPAGIHGKDLADLVRRADAILVPLLPSPLDIRAAQRFIGIIEGLKKVHDNEVRLATVANRVRENTLVAMDLEEYLHSLRLPNGKKFPFLSVLRGSQNYIRSAEKGLSIFEFSPYATEPDREQWAPLLRWVQSARAHP